MKSINLIVAGGLLMSLSVPVSAQMPPPRDDAGMHQNDPGPHGDMHGPDMRNGPGMGHGAGDDPMRDHPRMAGGHRDWHGGDRPHCRTVWHHHHRVRRCMR